MTREKTLQNEVRKAVRDYLDVLISQRSGSGNSQAVSSNDVLVAAKNAGQQAGKPKADPVGEEMGQTGMRAIRDNKPVNNQEADAVLEGIGQSGMRIIRDSQPERRALRSKSVPQGSKAKPTGPVKHRSQYHWMVWKTTPTPTPVTPVPLEVTTPVPAADPLPEPVPVTSTTVPAEPASMAIPTSVPASVPAPVPPAKPRPSSVASTTLAQYISPTKLDPSCPSPRPIALNSPTPEPFRTPVLDVANIIASSKPAAIQVQKPTPLATKQAPTPDEMKPDHRDVLSSPQVMPTVTEIRKATVDKKTYEPAIQAWVSSANDDDRKVAFSFFKALNGGRSISSAASRPGATSRLSIDDPVHRPNAPAATRSVTVPAAGVRTSVPMFSQKYPDLEEKYIKKLQSSFDSPERCQTPRPSSRLYFQRPASHCGSVAGRRAQSPCRPPSRAHDPTSVSRPRSTLDRPGARPRYPLRLPSPKEYICEGSFFMNSQLPYQRDFIINPEWVSEVKTRNRQTREARQARQAFQTRTCRCTYSACT